MVHGVFFEFYLDDTFFIRFR